MSQKDFLSQFTDENKKPDSFKEEERIPVNKPNKFNVKTLLIVLISLIVIGAIAWFIFLRPTISVVDFTGQKRSDAIAWLKQQGIENSGVLFKEEYNFDVAEDIIVSQDPSNGKIKTNAIMTFVVSKGPDPDEKVKYQDVSDMTKEEIEAWIKKEKLLSTKINTTYSEDVEEGRVIKKEFTGCDEDSFTRGCTLKISISKGPKPKEEVTVEDFVSKTEAEASAWAKEKKVELKVQEAYSDKVEIGKIISQVPLAKSKMSQGETLTITVSKGKVLYMPDFSNYTEKEVLKWFSNNAVMGYEIEKKYSDVEEDKVISYSPLKGTQLNEKSNIVVTISLGNEVKPYTGGVGSLLSDLEEYVENLNKEGANIKIVVGEDQVYSDVHHKGAIVSMMCTNTDGSQNDLKSDIPMDVTYYVSISKGKISELDFSECKDENDKLVTVKVVDYLSSLSIPFNSRTEDENCIVMIIHNDSSIEKDDPRYFEGDTIEVVSIKK